VTLSGGLGNDSLYGNFSGKIFGYAETGVITDPATEIGDIFDRDANDYLIGGDGNDYLYGALGNDTMEGGLGNDTIVMTSSFDSQVLSDYDRILEFGYEGDPANGGIDWVRYNGGGMLDLKDVYTNPGLFGGPNAQLQYVQNGMFIENMQGSGATLSGNWLNNTILGGAGSTNESLSGELGNDFLCGVEIDGVSDGTKYDGTYISGGLDTLTGGAGNDTFSLRDDDGRHLYFDGGAMGGGSDKYALITDFNLTGTDLILRGTVLPGDFDGDSRTLVRHLTEQGFSGVAGYSKADLIVDGGAFDIIAVYN
jgi:hypothetical protein